MNANSSASTTANGDLFHNIRHKAIHPLRDRHEEKMLQD